MARTRLRGLTIAGIQMGIEVPETCPWEWPDTAVADWQSLPREPEVAVGVRVARVDDAMVGAERYAICGWTFEVARAGSDWLLGLVRRGRREQLARFDADYRVGEILMSPEAARSRHYPLRGPLDQWIVLHRTIARGGLCLTGTVGERAHEAVLRLGAARRGVANAWSSGPTLLGDRVLVLRPERERARWFRTPWNERFDSRLRDEMPVRGIEQREPTPLPYRAQLDPDELADRLVQHAIVPLNDEAVLDRVLRNAREIADRVPGVELGVRQGNVPSVPASRRGASVPIATNG